MVHHNNNKISWGLIMKKSFCLLLLLIISNTIFAHNYLFEQDKNGLSIEASAYKINSDYVIGASLGYTINGRTSLNAIFSNQYHKESNSDSHVSYGANFSYLILKQKNGEIPLNLSLNASYDFFIHNIDLSHDNYISSNSHIIGFETEISHELIFDKNLSIIPSAGIKFENENITYLHLPDNGYFGPWPTKVNVINYSLQGTIIFKRIYLFCNINYISNASWDTVFSLYYKNTQLGMGIILS
jgi:hypothetical protein